MMLYSSYQVWWMYLLVSFAFSGLLSYLIAKRWYTGMLRQQKENKDVILEEMVQERTKVVHQQFRQLEEGFQKLKDKDQVKSRYFADISHEFRTPLTLIMGPLQQMLSQCNNNRQLESLNMMYRNTRRLLHKINQLLELSRFDDGKMNLKVLRRNIVPFLKDSLSSFHMLALENRLDLELDSEEDELFLYFDTLKMEEVINNLIINAIKFTPAEGRIKVSVSREYHSRAQSSQPKNSISRFFWKCIKPGYAHQDEKDDSGILGEPFTGEGYARISVRDTGIGIPEEKRKYIFDRFYHSDGVLRKTNKGTGLGLALSKEIIQLHSGTIEVKSREGEGSEFIIRLPLGKKHLSPEEISNTAEFRKYDNKYNTEGVDHNTECLDDDTYSIEKDEMNAVKANQDHQELNGNNQEYSRENDLVLVVEDNEEMRLYIENTLKIHDFSVLGAEDGKQAIQKVRQFHPQLIVSDIRMPGMSGYELCRELKCDPSSSHIPIILLTAKASDDSIVKGLDTGADDYVTKPFNERILASRIKNLILQRRQLRWKLLFDKMPESSQSSMSSANQRLLDNFLDIIEKEFSDPDFNIDTICEKLDMGRSTLFKKIKDLTGAPPNQHILNYRLDCGAKFLKQCYGNVTDVALAVGFSSSAYFSKLFKDKFGLSPSDFQATQTTP